MGGKRRTSLIQEAAEASRGTLLLTKVGSSWPAEGELRIGSASTPARIYVGAIGESHRGRDGERRFQNPGSNKPISVEDGSLTLLLGIRESDGGGADPILVGMDAYRRAGLKTRFSMFIPAALLADAEERGLAEHENESGEKIVAFRASRISDYLSTVMSVRGKGLDWKEEGFGHPPPKGTPKRATSAKAASQSRSLSELHIRPKVGMYAAFARLNYKPWFAIAEFVDNSVQSYLASREALGREPLEVHVRFDDDEIVITDHAAGIAERELPRAFSPSQPPPDASGLSEFGLGMKAAACWFSRYWTVRTKALGENVERLIRFDVDKITSTGIEQIPIEARPAKPDDHFTVITLRNLRVKPQGRTLGKVKEHLASIYRVLTEKGHVRLRVTTSSGSEVLELKRPPLLVAPYYREPSAEPREWKTNFRIDLGQGRLVWGWAGLLDRGSVSHAGLSVFRRDRLIQGSADETYRPSRIFRSPNSYTYQRLVGELFVEGFDVSHTKDGIEWAGLEDELLAKLHKELTSMKMPMLAQAEGYRSRHRAKDLPRAFGAEALVGAAAELEAESTTPLVSPLTDKATSAAPAAQSEVAAQPDVHQSYSIELDEAGQKFAVSLALIRDSAEEWYGYRGELVDGVHRINVWINLAHPFSEAYVNSDENTLSPLLRLVCALVFVEYSARQSGQKMPSLMRHRVNELLRNRFGDRAGGMNGREN